MSFNFGSSSGKISFAPATFNVEWDGVSRARAVFQIDCFSSAATYSASAYRVFHTSSFSVCSYNTNTVNETVKGTRYWQYEYGNTACARQFSPDISLPVTAANGTAAVLFSALTATAYTYAWKLVANNPSDSQVLVTGRITASEFNAYVKTSPTVSLVSGVTAGGCS